MLSRRELCSRTMSNQSNQMPSMSGTNETLQVSIISTFRLCGGVYEHTKFCSMKDPFVEKDDA